MQGAHNLVELVVVRIVVALVADFEVFVLAEHLA